MRVLIADDSKAMRMIVLRTLRQSGLQIDEVHEAEDGADALAAVPTFAPDLIMSDWNMPNMTGIELLRAIRSDPELKHLPVLMVTAEAKKENIIEAAQAGASGYVVKPFTAATLDEKLGKILQKQGVTQ